MRYAARAARPPAATISAVASRAREREGGTGTAVSLMTDERPPMLRSANARSEADWNRASGALFRQRSMMTRSVAGTESGSGGGSSRSTALDTSAVVAPPKGRSPDAIS